MDVLENLVLNSLSLFGLTVTSCNPDMASLTCEVASWEWTESQRIHLYDPSWICVTITYDFETDQGTSQRSQPGVAVLSQSTTVTHHARAPAVSSTESQPQVPENTDASRFTAASMAASHIIGDGAQQLSASPSSQGNARQSLCRTVLHSRPRQHSGDQDPDPKGSTSQALHPATQQQLAQPHQSRASISAAGPRRPSDRGTRVGEAAVQKEKLQKAKAEGYLERHRQRAGSMGTSPTRRQQEEGYRRRPAWSSMFAGFHSLDRLAAITSSPPKQQSLAIPPQLVQAHVQPTWRTSERGSAGESRRGSLQSGDSCLPTPRTELAG
jgi:hypothetical protein